MDLKKSCKQVVELSCEVGNFIKKESNKITLKNIEIKSTNDFVTYVDKASEKKITTRLQDLIPDAGFIAEENTISKKSDDYNWIVDPLDGTTNFIHSAPPYCTSIGLTYKGKLVLGVVHEITLNETFYAWENSKAYLNGNEIKVSNKPTLNDSLLATGFPYYDYSKLDVYVDLFKYLMQHTHGIRRLGSAAADLAYVACGRYEGFYEYGLKPWDVAAGAFIIQQAGGAICDFKGENNYLFGQEIIATNNLTHAEMIDVVKMFFKRGSKN